MNNLFWKKLRQLIHEETDGLNISYNESIINSFFKKLHMSLLELGMENRRNSKQTITTTNVNDRKDMRVIL